MKPSQSYIGEFTTRSGNVATDADSLPTAVAHKNGTLDAAFTLTVASTGVTGGYKVTGTLPGGYVGGDIVHIIATAVVGGNTDRAPIERFEIDTKRVGDLNDAVAAPSASANATAVRTELATELAHLNVDVDSRAVAGDAMTLTSGERTTLTASVWNALTSGLTTTNSIGKRLLDFVTTLVYGAPPTAVTVASAVRTEIATELAHLNDDISSRSSHTAADVAALILVTPGNKLATDGSGQVTVGTIINAVLLAIANKVEAEIIDETDSEKVLDAITSKIAAVNPDLGSLTINAIALAVRDAILNRLLPGNHDTANTVGRRLQALPESGTVNVVVPNNSVLTLIQAQTDKLDFTGTAGMLKSQATNLDSLATAGNITAAQAAIILAMPPAPNNSGIADIKAKTDLLTSDIANAAARLLVMSEASGGGYRFTASTLSQGPSAGGLTQETIDRLEASELILLAQPFVPTEAPVIVAPDAPLEVGVCRVYGNFETITNLPAKGLEINFKLDSFRWTASERIIAGRSVVAKTDAQGRLFSSAGLYLELQRNDNLTPFDTRYLVSCKELGLQSKAMQLTSETFDLFTLVTEP